MIRAAKAARILRFLNKNTPQRVYYVNGARDWTCSEAPALPVTVMLLRPSWTVVPATGLEPARLAAYAPKAYVYTNFTTRA